MDHFYNRMLTATRMITTCLVLLVMVSPQVKAQSTTIQGSITDATDGSPIVGANILIKSTTHGTITDVDGKFTVECEKSKVRMIQRD